MFKFKKIFLLPILFSAVIFTFIFGYPVNTYKEQEKGGFIYTKRCFKVGELRQFFNCFKTGKQIRAGRLITEVNEKTASLFPYFNVIFFAALVFSMFILLFI